MGVRRQPLHSPVCSFIVHTETQGDATPAATGVTL